MSDNVVGLTVKFGRYSIQDESDNSEMEWLVLDSADEKLLLLSKYAIEAMPFHDCYEESTWERCSLRRWLNWTFYDLAFSDSEKRSIIQVLNSTPDPGELTKPKQVPDPYYPGTSHRVDVPASIEVRTARLTDHCSTLRRPRFRIEPTSRARRADQSRAPCRPLGG